jgi:hypothetical protein
LGKISKPDTKAFKKRMKMRTKMLKRKVKNNKTLNSIKFPELRLLDTIQADMGNRVVYTRFILLFKLKNQNFFSDTVIVSYTSEFKDIIQDDKDRLLYLLQKLNPGRIEIVLIREIINADTGREEDHHLIKKRERAIKMFFCKEGLAKSKIQIFPRSI